MDAYIGIAWNVNDSLSAGRAQQVVTQLVCTEQWIRGYNAPGFVVLLKRSSTPCQTVALARDTGIIVGRLFARARSTSHAAICTLSDKQTDEVFRTDGRVLVGNYWGRYVAFLNDPSGRTRRVVRDPTGRMPCFEIEHQGVRIFFSRIADIVPIRGLQFSVNWDYIAVRLFVALMEARETGLCEVRTVVGGECVEMHSDGSARRRLYWNPGTISSSSVAVNVSEAATLLKNTVEQCVVAWCSRYETVVHRLSGGLDSSIVAACLGRASPRPRVVCINFFSDGSDSDERRYARLAASQAGLPLRELERRADVNLEALLRLPRLPSPTYFAPLLLERAVAERTILAELDAGAIFDGGGGDGVFFQNPLRATVSDYITLNGWTPRVLRHAAGVALAENLSIWQVLRGATKDCRVTGQFNPRTPAIADNSIVEKSVLHQVREEKRFVHPWLEGSQHLPIGKQWHIHYLSVPLNYEDIVDANENIDVVEPLISQPLFEAVLPLPTYLLSSEGRDRALARAAFQNELPNEIVRRHAKGGIEQHAKALLTGNRTFVRAMLLDGILAQRGLLNRQNLAQLLHFAPSKLAPRMPAIYGYLGVEIWLRTWVGGLSADACSLAELTAFG